MEHVIVDRRFAAIEMLDERLQTTFVLEHVAFVVALVDQFDADAGVEERQLAQTFGENVVIERDVGEDRRARFETHGGAVTIGRADGGERGVDGAKSQEGVGGEVGHDDGGVRRGGRRRRVPGAG